MKIQAEFIGMQECPGENPFPLYNLLAPLPGHPCGSTVSLRTIKEAGYYPIEQEG